MFTFTGKIKSMSTFETIAVVLLGVILLALVWLITEFSGMKAAIKERTGINNETIKLRLQAYERLALVAERIALQNLISRIPNAGLTAKQMQHALIEAIKSEFEYNISQQIYVSPEAWRAVHNLKEQNIYIINQLTTTLPFQASAMDLNKQIIDYLMSNPKASLHTIVLEVLNAKKFGFTTAEFERAKKETLENYVERAAEKDKTESSRFANEYVNNFLDKEASPGIEAEKKYVDQYFAKLTLAEANAAIAKLDINAPAYVLFTALESAKNLPTEASLLAAYKAAKLQTPKAYEEKAVAKELIDVMPAAGKVVNTESNADFGTKSYTLSNGIKVICKKTDYKNDEILLSGFQWGGNSNLTEREIVVSKYLRTVVNSLGLGTHNSSELQKMLTGVNAMATLSSSNNTLSVNGKSTVKDFEKFMQILHLRLTNVNFDSEEMDGMRSSSKQQIGMLKNNPSLKFVDTLNMFKYSNSKRFAYFPYLEEMATVSNDDIKNLYKKLTSNLNGLTLVLIGNVDDANIATMLEKYVGSITTKSEKISLNTANIIRPVIGKNTFLVKGGKEKKSEINHTYYGNITSFDDKENLSYGLLAEVLQMKTTEKLREEMGGTYSPRVGGQMTRPPMLEYSLSLIVPSAPENVDKLTAAFDEIVAKVAGGDISDDDMLKAKEQRKKALETQMKTNNYWLQIVESQDMYKFNTSLITTYFTRLNDITKADLVSVAKKYLTNANILKAVMNPE